jgi:hypothetical protein
MKTDNPVIHFGMGRHADILPEGNIVIIAKVRLP